MSLKELRQDLADVRSEMDTVQDELASIQVDLDDALEELHEWRDAAGAILEPLGIDHDDRGPTHLRAVLVGLSTPRLVGYLKCRTEGCNNEARYYVGDELAFCGLCDIRYNDGQGRRR